MNTKITPKDFFLHLGATVALFAAVIALINLSFSVINYYLPDQLAGYFYANNIAWPISMLVILTPLLYVIEYFIIRDIRKSPEKANLWIRNWRIYLTLFFTGATIVGDLITLINVYLNGEISSRFIYKVLIVLIIAGIVFVYYLLTKTQVHEQDGVVTKSKSQITLAWIGLVMVLLAIVTGFIAVGSPNKQRNLRFDGERVNDLSNIQWQVISHWQQKGTLPNSLSDLKDNVSGYNIPLDPKTESAYEYAVIKTLSSANPSFELCANFALSTQDNKGRGDFYGSNSYPTMAISSRYDVGYYEGNDNWKHEAGRVCFTRTIDPDKYPIIKK